MIVRVIGKLINIFIVIMRSIFSYFIEFIVIFIYLFIIVIF